MASPKKLSAVAKRAQGLDFGLHPLPALTPAVLADEAAEVQFGRDWEYIRQRKAKILAMIGQVSPLGSVKVKVDAAGKTKKKVEALRLLDRIAATLLAKEFPSALRVVDFGEHITVTKTSTLGAQTTSQDRAYFEDRGTLYGGEKAAQKLEEADLMIRARKVRL